jgi:uncharacterized protein YqfB (UPF0267 family)
MRVILFQDRFSDNVRAGFKTFTIRTRAWCEPGDALSLRRWTGKPYRSKQEVLREVRCASVLPVRITAHGIHVEGCYANRDRIAVSDGFRDWREMRDWFASVHGLPFNGVLISWVNGQTGSTGEA